MTHLRTFALLLALVAASCGGGDDDRANDDDGNAGGGNDPAIMSTGFDLADLPDNFPSDNVPPSWRAGQVSDLLGPYVVNFESDMAFADAVDHYTSIFGEPNALVGDPGEQLAQWYDDPTWILSVFDGDPVLIGFTDVTE